MDNYVTAAILRVEDERAFRIAKGWIPPEEAKHDESDHDQGNEEPVEWRAQRHQF